LVEHLLRSRPVVGERFLSDHELARISRLSRPTVRRALNDLERDGWIERRPGIGTFIGPRAGMPLHAHLDATRAQVRRTVRLALVIHLLGDLSHDWYAGGVMRGIDSAAEECGLLLELLGDRDGDIKSISRRLMQSRPDVLAFAAPPLRRIAVLGEARRLDIPCIGTGTLLASIGVPTVCEDGHAAMKQAVRHLVERGHRKIGLAMGPFHLPWVFQRRQGYVDGLAECGIEPDEGLVLWLSGSDPAANADLLRRYLDRRRPSALIFGSWAWAQAMAPLTRHGQLSIPRDLSIVTFDQQPTVETWLGHVRPTVVSIPLAEMGRRLAFMARDLAAGNPVAPVTTLACALMPGESVADQASTGSLPRSLVP
jgi:DNA-binding LacI/PurR family transcriptional regulator